MVKSTSDELVRPVTIAEVQGWFPVSQSYILNQIHLKKLWLAIENTRKIILNGRNVTPVQNQLARVSKAARGLRVEIDELLKIGDTYVRGNTLLNSLNDQIELLLAEAPGRANGSPPKEWNQSASKWAKIVAACIEKKNKSNPSATDPSGPVCHVLGQAIRRVYGLDNDTMSISRAIQRRNSRTQLS